MERRLAAILVADMAGYSRLMEKDEEGVFERQKTHRRELIDPEIAGHGGRIVKTTGDGMLVEFASAQDAVRCAIDIQTAMVERESTSPMDSRIMYRIGINLGDIVFDEGDVFGDGVNVASRLQGLSEPGGVCVSDIVHQAIADRYRRAVPRHGQTAREEHLPTNPGLAVDARRAGARDKTDRSGAPSARSLCHGAGWRSNRLGEYRRGAASAEGPQLAQPSRIRMAQPGLGPSLRRAGAPLPAGALRPARQRAVRLGGGTRSRKTR